MDDLSIVNLMPAIGSIGDAIWAAVGGAALWVVRRGLGWIQADKDVKFRDAVERALDAGIGFAREQALRKAEDWGEVRVRDEAIATAAQYALDTVPQALAHFGIDAAGARRRVEARLPLPEPQLIPGELLSVAEPPEASR